MNKSWAATNSVGKGQSLYYRCVSAHLFDWLFLFVSIYFDLKKYNCPRKRTLKPESRWGKKKSLTAVIFKLSGKERGKRDAEWRPWRVAANWHTPLRPRSAHCFARTSLRSGKWETRRLEGAKALWWSAAWWGRYLSMHCKRTTYIL